MANTYKYFTNNDRIAIRNPLYESKTLLRENFSSSDSSNVFVGNNNSYLSFYTGSIKTPSNLLFDITNGISSITSQSNGSDEKQKLSNYNELAKILYGIDYTGSIYRFDLDFDNNTTNTYPLEYAYFINLARRNVKDELRKGQFSAKIMINSGTADPSRYLEFVDYSGSNSSVIYKNDSPVGDYGALYLKEAVNVITASTVKPYDKPYGIVFYQAGTVLLSPFIFAKSGNNPVSTDTTTYFNSNSMGILETAATMSYDNVGSDKTIGYVFVSGSITGSAQALQNSILTMSYQTTTEVNSTVYFCRIFNNEFNYSSNPTYLDGSKIIVKSDDSMNPPVSYITTIGLYSDDNQLLAVAKLSEPIKKTPENELIIRVRLDF